MPRFDWELEITDSAQIDEDSGEWSEIWLVKGYDPPPFTPAWPELLLDRPDLRPGEYHANVIGAKVVGFNPERDGDVSDAWRVEVRYRATLGGGENNREDDPLQRRPEIDLDSESEEVPVDRDADGNALLNTAGDLIVGITESENRWVFRVAVNVPSYPTWLLNYGNAVNADVVRIVGLTIEPGYLLLKNPRIGKPIEETVDSRTTTFYPLSFCLHYHPRSWIRRIYNRGLYELEPFDDTDTATFLGGATQRLRRVRILDDNGDPVEEPQFLDRNGRRIRTTVKNEDGEDEEVVKWPLEESDIVTLEKWTKKRLPFRPLPIN